MSEESRSAELQKALEVFANIANDPSNEKGFYERPALPPANGYTMDADEGSDIHLRDYWRTVRKRLWLVISVALLFTIPVALFMARKPDIYEAEARVQINRESGGNSGIGARQGAPVILSTDSTDPAYFNTQIQILSSAALMRRVARTLDLENNRVFTNPQGQQNLSVWQNLLRLVGLHNVERTETAPPTSEIPTLTNSVAPGTPQDDLAEAIRLAPIVHRLQQNLIVERVIDPSSKSSTMETRLVDVRYRHADRELAAKIANAVSEAFALQNLERQTQENTSTGNFLARRVAELQSRIRADQERLINYSANNQILSLDAGQNTVVERLAGLNRQLLEAENERQTAEAAFRAAQNPGAASALSESADSTVLQAEGRLVELRQRRAQLLVGHTEEWPEVREVTQAIITLEGQIRDIRSRAGTTVLTNLETRYRQARAREQSLREAFNRQRSETLTQNSAAINYRIIQQEIDTNKSLLDSLLQGSRENDVVRAGMPNNIFIVDNALAPGAPVGPKRLQAVALALLLSTAFGIGLALFLEYLNDSIRTPDDVEKLLRLPAIGVIPAVGALARRRLLSPVTALQGSNGNGAGHPELLMNVDPRGPLSEAYRHLRTSVLLSTAGRPPKTLLVSSSVPSEGKTTTSINLATSLAQTGNSVVVIDADMRRPRLHSIFGLENEHGLSTILSREMSEQEILDTLKLHEATGLNVITSGPIPPNPAELIGSEPMQQLIKVLESRFSHIVIDSPPIAAFTDGVLLSTMVDGIVLVVHSGKSSLSVVRRARQIIHDVGGKIFGVVLNNTNISSTSDYYYYQRYYGANYYAKDKSSEAGA